MRVEWDADTNVKSIVAELSKLDNLTEKAERKAMKQIGKIIEKHLRDKMPMYLGDRNLKNYDGTRPYEDMRDDIHTTVKRSNGVSSLVVYGGRKTGYKWHLLDDGTRDASGKKHTPATHFTNKAMKAAEAEIDAYVDMIIREVANGNTD